MTSMSNGQSIQDKINAANADFASLGRVSHRLALVDASEKLSAVLDKLLPRLLQKIGDNHQEQLTTKNETLKAILSKIHGKLVEILSHTMKRVRDDEQTKLPCLAMLELFLQEDKRHAKKKVDPFTVNLSLAFMTLALPRCDTSSLEGILPSLLVLHGFYTQSVDALQSASVKSQWHQITHLLFRTMELISQADEESMKRNPSSMFSNKRHKIDETMQNSPTAGDDAMQHVRQVMRDPQVAAACYDFFLDLFLYQTVAGDVPPPGLSQAGHVRLKSGHSSTARDWGAEKAPRSQLCAAKTRFLDWIAPSQRRALFLEPTNVADGGSDLGMTRTVALLTVAAGDAAQEVSQRAMTYLKQHFDAQRDDAAYGNPSLLVLELLVMCVGANNASLALSSNIGTLGVQHTSSNQQAVLSFKRRMVSEATFATLATYISNILEEVPSLREADVSEIYRVGSLTVLACNKVLGALRTTTGLSMLRGKHYVAAAKLLNSLVVRVSTIKEEPGSGTIRSLLSKSLAVACTCLSTISKSRSNTSSIESARSSSSGSEGNTSVRDSLYGVVCVLSRSNFAIEEMSWLFSLGNMPQGDQVAPSVETAMLLFSCLASEEESLRPRAVAALDALLAAYCRVYADKSPSPTPPPSNDNPWQSMDTSMQSAPNTVELQQQKSDLSRQLLSLLWSASQQSQPKQSRVAAARWSSDLMTILDLTSAAHILCFLAGDSDNTASSMAKRGLGLHAVEKDDEESQGSKKSLADFALLAAELFTENQSTGSSWRPIFWEFPPQGKAVAVEYVLKCLLHDIYGGDDDSIQTFVFAISKSLLDAAARGRKHLELLDECAVALSLCLSTSSFARSLVGTNHAPLGSDDIQRLALTSNSSRARRVLAESWGHLHRDTLLWENDAWVSTVEQCLESCISVLRGTGSLGHKHGAAYLGGTCVKVYRLHPTLQASDSLANRACSILSLLGEGLTCQDDSVGNAFASGLAVALSYDQADAPTLDKRLYAGAKTALQELSKALRKFGCGDNVDVPRLSKVGQAAGVCLAATTTTDSSEDDIGLARLDCVEGLFLMLGSPAYRKEEEVALWTGEALAEYSDAFSPPNVRWDSEKTSWPATMDEMFAKSLPPHQQVVYTLLRRAKLENNPQKRTSTAPALFAVVARAAMKVNLDPSNSDRCLVQELCGRLEEVQSCFISLLADPKSKHLSRESCCLGLAACRSLANCRNHRTASQQTGDDLNERLLRAFGQTSNYGGSAMQETREQAEGRRQAEARAGNEPTGDTGGDMSIDAEVGGASGIGEAALGAYREMAGAAVSLGRPDMLYALLMLSVSNSAWFSEGRNYDPSSLMGQQSLLGNRSNAAEMRAALKSHLGKLIPRILRGCHAPNKDTREQMQNLWVGLTGGGAEARSAITEHLLSTVDTLISDTSSKLWRTRLGACGALAQVIVGRSWKELGGGPAVLFDDDVVASTSAEAATAGVRLLRLWRVAMRSLDDVRVNVREAGEALARGVRSLTLRLVDPHALQEAQTRSSEDAQHQKDASAAAATTLRWLIKHGLNQPCPEAAGVCVSCLVGIVDVANPNILRPLVPDLLRSLLFSMSSLEPAAFSYMQVRAAGQDSSSGDSYDSLERLRLQVVQSGPLATAVNKCLDMIPDMDLDTQRAVVPELDSALRLSAGLTTRTAAADCVSTLCATCPNAFKTSRSSINPSVSLLRALYAASERERGAAARDKMAHACGNLAALCPGPSVRSLALRAAEKYNSSTGSNDDPAARKAAAITLRSIAVKASNQFSDGGNGDVWCRRVLPVAFLGMRDDDPKVASLFGEVWEEGGSAANLAGAADGFGNLLEEKLIMHLVKECEKALKDVSWSRRMTGAVALKELAAKEILSPAPRSLQTSKGSGALDSAVRANRRAQASHRALLSLLKLIAETRLWSGKQHIIEAAVAVATKWSFALSSVQDEHVLLGTSEQNCMWRPVSLCTTDNKHDLFLGDQWFERGEAVEESGPEVRESMVVDDPTAPAEMEIDEDGDALEEPMAPDENTETLATQQLLPTYSGMCRLLLAQAFPTKRAVLSVTEEEVLPYRAAVLRSLAELMHALDDTERGNEQRRLVFEYFLKKLSPIFDAELHGATEESPLIVSKAIDCFASCFWNGIGMDHFSDERLANPPGLSSCFLRCSSQEQPWTVKESALHAGGHLVSKSASSSLRGHETISTLVESVSIALKDRKFWKVRLAGLELLNGLVDRAGKAIDSTVQTVDQDPAAQERQLLLEAILPQKERMVKMAKQTLSDSEAKVTASASNVLSSMAWWP